MTRSAPLLSLAMLAALAASAQAQVKLEYKFPENAKAAVKDTTKLHQILTIAGMDIETNVDETLVVGVAIGKRNADGTLPVAQTIESIRAELTLPGGIIIAYDSAAPDNPPVDNKDFAFLQDIFKVLAGEKHTVVLDGTNKAKFVEGTEAFEAKLATIDPKAAALIKKSMSADEIKREFDQAHANLPTVLAREGEPWEVTQSSDIGGDQTLTFRKRYEYRGTVEKGGRTLDKISVKATGVTYVMAPEAESPLKITKSDLKVDSSEGTLLFDREAGAVVESQESTRVKGDLTAMINGQELPSKLDLTLEKSTALEEPKK